MPLDMNTYLAAKKISSPSLQDRINNTQQTVKPTSSKDDFMKSGMSCRFKIDENYMGNDFIEGEVNGKQAVIKYAYSYSKTNGRTNYTQGLIDNKKILLKSQIPKNWDLSNINYTGEYNGKKFDLRIEQEKISKFSKFINKTRGLVYIPDYFNIKGTFGDKEVDIQIPNAKVPKDEDLKDITTLILDDFALSPIIIEDTIVNLNRTNDYWKTHDKIKEEKKNNFNNDVKPLILGLVSTAGSILIGLLIGKLTNGKNPPAN